MRVTVQEGDRSHEMFISTRCRSLDDFISMFGRYVDGNSIFVATLGARPEGLEAAFRIQLADGASVLRGRGVIRKVWTTGDNPFRLPGMLLGVRALTSRSKQVFDRMRKRPVAQLQVTGVEVVRPRRTVTIPPKQPRTATLPRIPSPPVPPPAMHDASIAELQMLPPIPPPPPQPLAWVARSPTQAASIAELHTPIGRKDPPSALTGRSVPRDGAVASPVDDAIITRRYLMDPPPSAVAADEARGEAFCHPTAVATPCPVRAPSGGVVAGVLPANPLATVSDDELSGFVESSVITPLDRLERKPGMTWRSAAVLVLLAGAGVFQVRSEADAAVPADDEARTHQLIHRPARATVGVGPRMEVTRCRRVGDDVEHRLHGRCGHDEWPRG